MSKTELLYQFVESGSAKVKSALKSVQEQQSGFVKSAKEAEAAFSAAAGKIQAAAAAAKKAWDFAREGAQARDAARAFAALGDAVPSIEALRAAGRNLIDDTSLQQLARLAAETDVSAVALEGLTSRITRAALEQGKGSEAIRFMEQALKGEIGALKELGIVFDISQKDFEGMSERAKQQTVVAMLAAEGWDTMGESFTSAEGKMLAVETQFANLKSSAQENFSVMLENSNVMAEMTEIMELLSGAMSSNDRGIGGMIGRLFELATPLVEGTLFLIDMYDSLKEVGEYFNPFGIAARLTIDALIGLADVIGTALSPALGWLSEQMEAGKEILADYTFGIIDLREHSGTMASYALEGANAFRAWRRASADASKATDEATAASIRFGIEAKRADGVVDSLQARLAAAKATLEEYHGAVVPKGVAERFQKDHLEMARSVAGLERQQVLALQSANEYWAAISGPASAEQIKAGIALTDASIRATGRLVEAQVALVEMAGMVDSVAHSTSSASAAVEATAVGMLANILNPLRVAISDIQFAYEVQLLPIMEEFHRAAITEPPPAIWQRWKDGLRGVAAAAKHTIGEQVRGYNILADIHEAEQEALRATRDAMFGIAGTTADVMDAVGETTIFKALVGIAEQVALAAAAFATPGMQLSGVGHLFAAGKFMVMEALGRSKGKGSLGGNGSAGSAGTASVSSGTADLAPPTSTAMPEREHTSTTVVMRWGDRDIGEAVIGAVNSAGRSTAHKIDREIVGSASRRGVI